MGKPHGQSPANFKLLLNRVHCQLAHARERKLYSFFIERA
jgi:hypothetical protein